MNVQFYLKRFDEAARIFDAIEGRQSPRLVLRHVRYHRELFEGDGSVTRSGWISGTGETTRRVHVMCNSDSGDLCTTVVDTLAESVSAPDPAYCSNDDDIKPALPRGLDGKPIRPQPVEELLKSTRAGACNYSIVEDRDLDSDDYLHTNRIISRFTDGAPHIWQMSGLTTEWLQENNFGRVAVEMKVMPLAGTSAGTALRLVSNVPDRRERTFRILHQLQEIASGRVIALGEVCCLVIDLEKRRVVDLPDDFLAD